MALFFSFTSICFVPILERKSMIYLLLTTYPNIKENYNIGMMIVFAKQPMFHYKSNAFTR